MLTNTKTTFGLKVVALRVKFTHQVWLKARLTTILKHHSRLQRVILYFPMDYRV